MRFTKTVLTTTVVSLASLSFPNITQAAAAGLFETGIQDAIAWGIGPVGGLSILFFHTLILKIADFFITIVGALSILGIVVGGIMYVMSAGNEQKATQAKRAIAFSILGLLIVLARVIIVRLIFNWLDVTPPSTIPYTSVTFWNIINNIIAFVEGLLAILATLFIIIGGFMYITSAGDEQKTGKAKQTVFAALAGLFIASIAGIISGIAEDIALDNPVNPVILGFKVFSIISFMLSFTAVIAVAAFVYGGFTYLASGGNDEKIQRGKKVIIYATIGIVVIMISAAIVNIVLGL